MPGVAHKKLVQFGAGKIGRAFIAQVFSRAGYEVVFVDVDRTLIEALNRRRRYEIVLKQDGQSDETVAVENVRAVDARDREAAARELVDASLACVSVGQAALARVAPTVAQGLIVRGRERPGCPLDVILAENARNAAMLFGEELRKHLGSEFPLAQTVGLVETSIGKMVPILSESDLLEDPLRLLAEPYNTLIVDRKGFLSGAPDVADVLAVDNIRAYVDRKLFIHNLGHSAAAYLAFHRAPGLAYVYEALEQADILSDARRCMEQAAAALNREYPGDLPMPALTDHIDDLLQRFRNRALGDTVFRAGRDLSRKLRKDERIVGAMLLAAKHDLPFEAIVKAFRAACSFAAVDDQGRPDPRDAEFRDRFAPDQWRRILVEVGGLSEESSLERRVIESVCRV
jgi:mannitol-1-phosphate 5-dehydrogenase